MDTPKKKVVKKKVKKKVARKRLTSEKIARPFLVEFFRFREECKLLDPALGDAVIVRLYAEEQRLEYNRARDAKVEEYLPKPESPLVFPAGSTAAATKPAWAAHEPPPAPKRPGGGKAWSKPTKVEGITCPECEGPMVERHAKKGPREGSMFYGCIDYPNCRGTRNP